MILPFEYGAGTLVRVWVGVGATRNSLLLWIEEEDAFPDAGPDDAGTPDARQPDAMP